MPSDDSRDDIAARTFELRVTSNVSHRQPSALSTDFNISADVGGSDFGPNDQGIAFDVACDDFAARGSQQSFAIGIHDVNVSGLRGKVQSHGFRYANLPVGNAYTGRGAGGDLDDITLACFLHADLAIGHLNFNRVGCSGFEYQIAGGSAQHECSGRRDGTLGEQAQRQQQGGEDGQSTDPQLHLWAPTM